MASKWLQLRAQDCFAFFSSLWAALSLSALLAYIAEACAAALPLSSLWATLSFYHYPLSRPLLLSVTGLPLSSLWAGNQMLLSQDKMLLN